MQKLQNTPSVIPSEYRSSLFGWRMSVLCNNYFKKIGRYDLKAVAMGSILAKVLDAYESLQLPGH